MDCCNICATYLPLQLPVNLLISVPALVHALHCNQWILHLWSNLIKAIGIYDIYKVHRIGKCYLATRNIQGWVKDKMAKFSTLSHHQSILQNKNLCERKCHKFIQFLWIHRIKFVWTNFLYTSQKLSTISIRNCIFQVAKHTVFKCIN